MKTSQKGFVGILALLVIIIAISIGTFYFIKNKNPDVRPGIDITTSTSVSTVTQPIRPSAPASTNPSTVAYADDAVEFNYPVGYSIKDTSPTGFKRVIISKGGIDVTIADVPTSFTTACGDDGCDEYMPKETISGFNVRYFKLPTGYLALANKSGLGFYVAATASSEVIAKSAGFKNTLTTILGSVTRPVSYYKGAFYSFSYPKNWGIWEQNALQGMVVVYPNTIGAQIMNKTFSNSDTINFSFVDAIDVDLTDLAKAEKITLNGLTWSFHVRKVPFDGGTQNVPAIEYVRKHDSDTYVLIHSASGNKPVIDAILSTYIQR